MPQITNSGVVPKTTQDYVTEIQNAFVTIFGDTMKFDINTPQGQLVNLMGVLLSTMDQQVVDVARSLDILQAEGQQLDDLASLLSVFRRGPSLTTVNAVLVGTGNTVVPAGSKATTGANTFTLQEDTLIDPTSGTASGFFVCDSSGQIAVDVGELNQISTPVTGWDSVYNSSAGDTGQETETDSEFTQRYFNQIAISSVSLLDSVISGVQSVGGVDQVIGVENYTSAITEVKGVLIPEHGFAIAATGGDDDEIAEAIRKHKSMGSDTRIPVLIDITGTPDYLIPSRTIIHSDSASNTYGADIFFENDNPIQISSAGTAQGYFFMTTEGDFELDVNEIDSFVDADITSVSNASIYRGVNTILNVLSVDEQTVIQELHVQHHRVEDVQVKLEVKLVKYANYPINGDSLIKERIVAYFDGTDEFVNDRFELDGLQIGEDVWKSRLYTPINSVEGHAIDQIDMSIMSDPLVLQDKLEISLNKKATIIADNISITT